MNELTVSEQTELRNLEAIVAQTEESAVLYVQTLSQIRQKKLYRATHPTWEAYCEDRWHKSHRGINMAIKADAIRNELAQNGKPLPKPSELPDKSALELSKLPPPARKKVFNRAKRNAGSKPISEKDVRKAATDSGFKQRPRGGLAAQALADQQDPEPKFNPYSSTQTTEPVSQSVVKPPNPASTQPPAPLPPVTDPKSAENRLRAYYKANTLALNSLAPMLILERFVKALHA